MMSCGGHILWVLSCCGEHNSDILFSTGYTHSRSPQEILNVFATGTHILCALSCGEQHDILWRTYPVGVILWRTLTGYVVHRISMYAVYE